MKLQVPVIGFCFLFFSNMAVAQQQQSIVQAEVWKDTDGNPVNAHGGGMLYYHNTYYWFGEIKKGNTWLVPNQSWEDYRVPAGGISCYSSADLINWQYRGVALAPLTGDPSHDLDTGKVIERPKVVYNKKTKKFVMWMHVDARDYSYSHSGVAVSDKPEGPFKYLGSVQPNGSMARDMTIFQDNDGKAYHIFSSENNATMHVCLLSDDYLSHTKTEKRIFIGSSREAPAMFKHNGKYYLITSGCTGWSPNPAVCAVADNPLGPWKENNNPCTGPDADSTFHAQSTFVLPVQGKKDAFIFMADKWNKTNLEDSRYIWLPLIFREGKPVIPWFERWNISFFIINSN
jgi:beta-xylosidase